MECCPRPSALCPGFTPSAHSLAHSPLYLAFGSVTAINDWCSEHVSSAVTRLIGGYRKCSPTFQVFSPTQSVRQVQGARPADIKRASLWRCTSVSQLYPRWVDARHRDKMTGDAGPCAVGRKDGTVLRTGVTEGWDRQAGGARAGLPPFRDLSAHPLYARCRPDWTHSSEQTGSHGCRETFWSCTRSCSQGRQHHCSLPRGAGCRQKGPQTQVLHGFAVSPRSCVLSIRHTPDAGAGRGRRAWPRGTFGAYLVGGPTATWE